MEQKCPQCGAPLPVGVLAGLCPACLFKQGAAADTAVPPETPPFQPPTVGELAGLFPQLEIIALIGKGGMGAVYQARQRGLDRIVALKILPPQTAGGPGFIERFNREARALARLNHPNIVAVYEFGQVNGLPFFVMEYVDGLNLRQLEQAGKLSAREALQIVPQICEALQFAHDEGIVHRDIKPENILLDKKGRVKIADFGIAKILSSQPDVAITQTGGAVGTPHYMAPEQMEKPTTVDHRADIFSLGVVFYEMLTGELPLGKFGPPSSRKIEVDVRLDDVVLRALEKDPERRYQHASQVKTAVDTIAGSAAPPPPPPPVANAVRLADEILARDYELNIRSCLRRSWVLVKKDFWPIVGVTALLIALFGFVSSLGGASFRHGPAGDNSTEITSAFSLLVWGPLMGGLSLYYLRRIRGEPVNIEVAFSGFSQRFLHLFLAGFVTWMLAGLGFVCLILPGIYLMVAWWFTIILVADKQLDFWPAMELSRKVVTRHWWKFFGLWLVMALVCALGVICCGIGIFIAAPVAMIATTYAYEDVFGRKTPAPSGSGPSGTVVMPPSPPPRAGGTTWTTATKIALALVALMIVLFVAITLVNHVSGRKAVSRAATVRQMQKGAAPAVRADETNAPGEWVSPAVFGPVTEQALTNLAAIKLMSGQMASLPSSIAQQSRGPEKDSAACAWLDGEAMDFAFVSDYDGFYGMTRDVVILKPGDWDSATPGSLTGLLHDMGRNVPVKFGGSSRLDSPTNCIYGFKTRAGSLGLLQITGFTSNPPAARIRYKLFQPATNQDPAVEDPVTTDLRENLAERLDAASSINDPIAKDQPLAAIALDAAKTGEAEIAKKAIAQMYDFSRRNQAAHEVALLLAKRGLHKPAIEIAKSINDYDLRNQTLSELAQ
ncbi:MAG: protein kinase [Verrucomicrobiae bacterium]|nr:protein kinase [Verrucomicrobiae bacterium]